MFGSETQRKYVFHAITGREPGNGNATCATDVNTAQAPGVQYQRLAELTGGLTASICENDWSPIFESIASGVVSRLACEYTIPEPPNGQVIDPARISVRYTPSGGSTEDVLRDSTVACDAGANGWQFSDDYRRVILCGETCDRVREDPSGSISIDFACRSGSRG
jgi:hypothetical protein